MSREAQRAVSDRAFVLHSYPYSETSAVVEAFTAGHGRVVCMAKGAKRPTSKLRPALQPFQGMIVEFSGKADVKTLRSIELGDIAPQLSGHALLSAFYMNELLLKLLQREDPHEALFSTYAASLARLQAIAIDLARGQQTLVEAIPAIEAVLREFEARLLADTGYAISAADTADSHTPLAARGRYWYVAGRGALEHDPGDDAVEVSGQTLMDIAANRFDRPATVREAKALMRMLIQRQLNGRSLRSRELFRDLQKKGVV